MYVYKSYDKSLKKQYSWLNIFVKDILSSKKNQFSFSDFPNNTNL